MSALAALRDRGVRAGLGAAALFGGATPLAALLLGSTSPWMLAALLYLGSGLGLFAYRRITRAARVRLPRADLPWLVGAVVSGGVAGPVLLMLGLTGMPASDASLLLTSEGAFTALIAWVVFRENVDRRVALGFVLIMLGAALLAVPAGSSGPAGSGSGAGAGTVAAPGAVWPALAVLAACALWAVDNNLTRRVSLTDETWLAAVKGAVAGTVNLGLALLTGSALPALPVLLAAGALGLVSYGISLVLFVVALRDLGVARTGAYFSVAPFVGASLAVLLGDPPSWRLVVAGALMGAGVWAHLAERHEHEHLHPAITHAHRILPDEHHRGLLGPVAPGADPAAPRQHQHPSVRHTHRHYPDAHHRHEH